MEMRLVIVNCFVRPIKADVVNARDRSGQSVVSVQHCAAREKRQPYPQGPLSSSLKEDIRATEFGGND